VAQWNFPRFMNLSARLAFDFDKRVQFQGMGLARGGAVKVTDSGFDFMVARVQGGKLFHVGLSLEDTKLLVNCECSYFAEWGPCKHLWAAILEADRLDVLTGARHVKQLSLVPEEYEPDFEDEDDEEDVEEEDIPPRTLVTSRYKVPPPPQIPAWEEHLGAIRRGLEQRSSRTAAGWPHGFEIWYVIDISASKTAGAIVVDLLSRSRKKTGDWTVYKELRLAPGQAGTLPDPADRDATAAIFGGQEYFSMQYSSVYGSSRKTLPPVLALKLLPQLAATGRLAVRADAVLASHLEPAGWDEGEPWKLWLDVRQDDRDQWKITGSLRRPLQEPQGIREAVASVPAGAAAPSSDVPTERMDLSEPLLLLESGFLVARGLVARFDHNGAFAWVTQLRNVKNIPFPDRERDQVIGKLLECAVIPPLDIDEGLRFEQRQAELKPGLRITQKRDWEGEYFEARLILNYGSGWQEYFVSGGGTWLPGERVFLLRDQAGEQRACDTLEGAGLRVRDEAHGIWRLPVKTMPKAVRELVHEGWHVEAEGKAFRRPGESKVDVRSGIDWFELHAEVDYGGGTSATLPQLLAALRRGDTMVALGDGSFGLLPEEWLERFAPLAGLGSKQEDHLRFKPNQAGLLDALLAAQPDVRVDKVFEQARDRMRGFHGVAIAPQPAGFCGKLRDYQREGLGWMEFLREFGFGGCLADDMGVGKTAQVLAVLEARRTEGKGPSLVVAPRSVIFNWREESARFTPLLSVLEHTGITRDTALIQEHNLVLTTYGTMLRDIAQLSGIQFDYVVLDEAQAVKNASTASAKAVRLLRSSHRLALSGTPVENHLGELWSLFEFLNPGMLGEAKVLKMAGGLGRNPGEEARTLLAHALRPFILRRTKRQVARELPEKTEQTIFCELDAPQRKQYDELRKHYRDTLLLKVKEQGLGRSKMHVLEALLRLRQAACHPGLLDPKRGGESSAKLDTLMAQLDEVRQEGHKALVFSQFTSLLAIVRRRLDADQIRYEYLDGSTRDRQACVENFQNDSGCGLFLISLKAGGLGLNLTAAEYVFLLDPWWNPAVEAQAVDRAHRIGQTRPVFAYRLIARNTVEEKVLELQKSKRDLADAILGEDNSLIRDLKREDLELLLS
jgi:SNF2 domain-containing protein/helicase-like protein